MHSLSLDFRLALRTIRMNPGYATAAILTLAIGIGANASVFNLGYSLLARPIPGVFDPDRLMSLTFMSADRTGAGLISHPELTRLRDGVPALTGVAAYRDTELHVAIDGGAARRVQADVVSPGYFDVLGAPVALGRPFTSDEATNPSAPPAVIVSHGFWQSAFAGAADVLGRSVVINGERFVVVGVTRAGFAGTSRAGRAEIWVPSAQHRLVLPMYRGEVLSAETAAIYFGIVGRLADGSSIEQVEAQANATRVSVPGRAGARRANWVFVARAGAEPTPWLRERVDRLMLSLTGAVVLLLTLTCANVANLLLARASGRRREIATRLALGASRRSIIRLLLIESSVLALCGAIAAVGVTAGAARVLAGQVLIPGIVTVGSMPMDWTVWLFAAAVSLFVAIAAGAAPAFTVSRSKYGVAARGQVEGASRLQRVLTVAQVAVSVALLLGAALLMRSMQARLAIPLGFDPSQVLSVSLEPALQRYTPQRTDAFYRDLLSRVSSDPQVRAAGLAWLAPFSQGASDTSLWAEGATAESAVSANHNIASPGFLSAMGIPLLEGRDFTEQEFLRRETPGSGVVIVTASLARRLFGDGPAAGRRVTMRYPEGMVRTVVGVIPDQRHHRVMDPEPDLVLEPFGQSFTPGFAALQVAANGPVTAVVDRVAAIVRDLDPTLPLFQVHTVEAALSRSLNEERLVARSVSMFAALAMLVAAIGLAAVLARAVTSRRREFGVRMACGATPARVAAQVTREAAWLVGVGIAGGLVLSAWFIGLVQARLYGVEATDPASVALIVVGTLAVGLLAAIIPARRAAAVAPAEVLR